MLLISTPLPLAAVCSALTLVGNLTHDAIEKEGYDNEDAIRDLLLIGDAIRFATCQE